MRYIKQPRRRKITECRNFEQQAEVVRWTGCKVSMEVSAEGRKALHSLPSYCRAYSNAEGKSGG
jgi:hypothetical protein